MLVLLECCYKEKGSLTSLCVVFVFICVSNVVIAFRLSFVIEADKQKATKYKNKLGRYS
jgi:hypothetical protein